MTKKEWVKETPGWEITIFIPEVAGEEFVDKLFGDIADLAYESQPEERNWDVLASVAKNPVNLPAHWIEEALNG